MEKARRFQHTAARRRLQTVELLKQAICKFQHTAARRRLRAKRKGLAFPTVVSTHSRPKAAASCVVVWAYCFNGFNTQPPEGGCCWLVQGKVLSATVSTHSRPKAAAFVAHISRPIYRVSTHSRPKAAASNTVMCWNIYTCFNTQPPEGGCSLYKKMIKISKLFTVFRYPLKYKEYQEV